jgi:hypothetical protein
MDRGFKNKPHPPERVLTLGKQPKRPATFAVDRVVGVMGDLYEAADAADATACSRIGSW